MNKVRTAAVVIALLLMTTPARTVAQRTIAAGPRLRAVAADEKIVRAVQQVSPAQLKHTIEKLAAFRTRNTISSAAPEANSIGAAREWIKKQFERYSADCGGCLDVKTDSFVQPVSARVPQPTEIVNVYAILRGSDPQNAARMYVVSGHYDSRGSDVLDAQAPAPGANDDASGTAVVLECARVLSKHKFPATIIFLTVAGEEQGLYGSRHFAAMARQQGWDIAGVLNNDIVGGNRSPGQDTSIVRIFSEGIPVTLVESPAAQAESAQKQVATLRQLGAENDSPSRQLARYVRETARLYLPKQFGPKLVFRPDRYLRGGDQSSFNEQGFAAVRLTEYRENYAHQHQNPRQENGIEYGDLPKFVDYGYVANVARLNVASLAALASAPAPPVNVRLETKQLENDSTLAWSHAPGGLASGYEVLWRPTTSAEWDNVEPVGNVSRATLKRSKDNVIFAVRAVDSKGHKSLPVVPVPER
ncbi:MAG: M28 family metallopeptidase [Terriglobales bacterium]